MDLVKSTIEFNKKLAQIRKYTTQYAETVESMRLKGRKKSCVAELRNSWTSPYVGIHTQYNTDVGPRKRGRPTKDYETDLTNLKPGTVVFTCLGCSRQLEIKKKYAKGQCQACYKRNKKTEENEIN
jgi:hypothetical protein